LGIRRIRRLVKMPIGINMDKAKEIHKDNLRVARKPLLEALDVEYIRTLEQGGDVADVADRKQTLRDVTADPVIDSATTPEELKAHWPECLGVDCPYHNH
jgi:hypothetical protein